MKNALKVTALFLLVTLSFTSCSKSDDNSATSGNIVAKWNYSKEGEIVSGQEVLTDYQHEAGCTKDNVEFKSNGTFTFTEYGTNCVVSTYNGTYTKSGDTVVATALGSSTTLTVLQLDASTLKVKYTDTFDGTTTTHVEVYIKG